MASELLDIVENIELWGDPDIVKLSGYLNETRKNFFLTVELKNHYFRSPISFTMKRDTRNDFNFNYVSHELHTQGIITEMIDGVERNTGVISLNASLDTNTKKIEVIINPNRIVYYEKPEPEPEPDPELPVEPEPDPELPVEPEPEPETVSLSVPDYGPDFNYYELVKDGKIELLVNDVKLNFVMSKWGSETLEDIEVIAYNPLKVTIVNNQVHNIFNLDEIEFIEEKYDPFLDERVVLDRTPDIATADKIEWSIDSNDWDRMIKRNRLDMLPYLYFTARPTEPTINYPFLKLYEISDDELKKLSKELIDYNVNPNNEDLTGYVNNLIRVPYPITSNDETVGIQVYNHGFTATGNLIDDYIQEIKLGRIKCTHEMLTGIGYKNIEFTLYVPYFKPITLEVPKVIDRNLDLFLKLDLTNGTGTLNILIDGTTYLIENQKIAKDIPFRVDSINISLDDSIYNNKFKYPYITVTVLNPDNTIDSKGLKQREINRTTLSYVKSDKIYLNSKANYIEQLEIESLIRKGVFINGKN